VKLQSAEIVNHHQVGFAPAR